MGDLSPIDPDGRLAVTITVAPHWADHRFQGRAVLPAMEALQLLACWAQAHRPGLGVHCQRNAAFDKFLELPPPGQSVAAWCELRTQPDGALRAVLLTKIQARSSRMTRAKVHAQVDFYPRDEAPPPAALDLAAALTGRCFIVEPDAIYRHLVPFGPGFRTIARPLLVTAEGALALIDAPGDDPADAPLGAPRVLDAALHAACVWGQRHAGIVAFPVGFAERVIVQPTRPGDSYVSRIFPMSSAAGTLTFDVWILNLVGELFEILRGVRMRDVSGGTLRPPEWIEAEKKDGLESIAGTCAALVLIERATLMPFAGRCFTDGERQRTAKMSPKRFTDYASSRLACKRLFRRLRGDDERTPAAAIHTLADDGTRPTAATADFYCSVAHDRRFTLALASRSPIGVDVEHVAGRILKSLSIFADEAEQALVAASLLSPLAAAARIWTIKEAAAKMLNIHLAEAWVRVRVLAIGPDESRVTVETGAAVAVRHVELEDHLITVMHAL
jgi:phosphopantetheinyl transferase